LSLNLTESLEFFNSEKLTFFVNNPSSVCLPTGKKIRLFFVSFENICTLLIPRENIEISVVPGEIKFIDLRFSEIKKFIGLIELNHCRPNFNPIFFNIVEYSTFLEHKSTINSTVPVIYQDTIKRFYSNP